MELKTDTTRKRHRCILSKWIKNTPALILFTLTATSYAQTDSCSAHAHFSLSTTDYKNITITNQSWGNNLSYQWSFDDGTSNTTVNPGTHTYASSGTHYVVLQVTDVVKNCTSFYADTVGVPCDAGFSWTTNLYDVSFTANASMNAATTLFSWNFGDGATSTLANPSHHYSSPGAYHTCLTVTSTLDPNCSNTGCAYMYIMDTTSTDTTQVICSADYSYYRLYGYTYAFYAKNDGLNYSWNFDDGTTSTLRNPEHTFTNGHAYGVCLTVSSTTGSPCNDRHCEAIDVTIPHYCKANFTIQPDSSTSDPFDFLIYNLSTGNNLTYLWEFGDGTTSTSANPIHDYPGTGPYTICLSVNSDSCHSIHCDTLDLSDTLHHLLSNKFHVTVVNKTTGIKKNDRTQASLLNYPNPFNGTTTICYSISESSAVEIDVYSLLGVKVATIEAGTKAPGNYTLDWDAHHLQEGIYMLQLKANDKSITKKIIIQK